MDDWYKKGCDECRSRWLSGAGLKKLGISDERHASLHVCDKCGTFWELYERFVDTIPEADAAAVYGCDKVSCQMELKRDFEPTNALESSLIAAQKGSIPVVRFLSEMLESEVFIVSTREAVDNTFDPVQYERAGEYFVAVFTSLERTAPVATQYPFCLSLRGSELLRRLNPTVGMVLNPGWSVGFELPASGLEGIRRDFFH